MVLSPCCYRFKVECVVLILVSCNVASRVCGNPHGLIRKYGIMCCRQCFRSNAKEIGFIKVSFLSTRSTIFAFIGISTSGKMNCCLAFYQFYLRHFKLLLFHRSVYDVYCFQMILKLKLESF